jgi:hypothetical protein
MPDRKIDVSGTGVLVVGKDKVEDIKYSISGTKKKRLAPPPTEIIISADLAGTIHNSEIVPADVQARAVQMECGLIRQDGRLVPIEFNVFPSFQVMRASRDDAWTDAVLGD